MVIEVRIVVLSWAGESDNRVGKQYLEMLHILVCGGGYMDIYKRENSPSYALMISTLYTFHCKVQISPPRLMC